MPRICFIVLLVLLAGALSWAQGVDSLLQESVAALERNDWETARGKLERAAKLAPRDGRVWLLLLEANRRLKREGAAQAAARQAGRWGGKVAMVAQTLSLYYAEREQYKEAAEWGARYAELQPDDRGALPTAAALYLDAGLPQRTIELARKSLEREERAEVRNLLGKAYEAAGMSHEAVVELQKAIQLRPFDETYYFDLAEVLLAHQNFDVAIRVLEAGRKVFDKSAQLELRLGVAYYGQRRFQEAVDALLRAMSLDASLPQPYSFLGRILEHAEGRLPEVVEKFAAFREANPDNPAAYTVEAKAIAAMLPPAGYPAEAEEAEKLLRKALELKEESAEAHFELGLLLERKRDYEAAAKELERAIALQPRSPAPHYRLARVYDRLGRAEDARRERELHARMMEEEKALVEKRASGMQRMELVVK